jgi:hypothetical protein
MDFDFTADEEAFRAELRAFLDDELPTWWRTVFVDDDLEPGLLAGLTHHRLVQRLAPLDPASGHRPLPLRRSPPPPDEQERLQVGAHRAHRDLRRTHGRTVPGSRRWCMARARAVKPCAS